MTSEQECYVYIVLPGETEFVTAGRFRLSATPQGSSIGTFIYGRSYRERNNAVALDPVELRLQTGEFETALMGGFFGAIRDAMPDSWGRKVIERHVNAPQLSEMDYLMRAPDDRAGALGFGLNREPPSPENLFNKTLDLNRLQRAADALIADDPELAGSAGEQAENLLLLGGTAMGGARPKAVVEDEGALWLAKFSRIDDRWNHPRTENAMLELARACGINAIDSKLTTIADRDVLLVRRFDRDSTDAGNYRRHRMVSSLTLLRTDDDATVRRNWSYLIFADELRRVSFNAATSNLDDHPRNHALVAKGDHWRLSPAYDLTPSPVISKDRRDLAMACGLEGRIANKRNILSGHGRFLLSGEEAEQIFSTVTQTVNAGWRAAMGRAGVSAQDCERRRDILLYSVSAILILDTVASSAAIGVVSISWWLILGAAFFLPFALISAELGCTYPDSGGIYAWVKRAFGGRWAGRIAWYYWVNVAVWCPSIYVLIVGVLSQWLSLELSLTTQVIVGVGLSWLTVLVNWLTLDIGKWVPNVGAVLKLIIFAAIIIGAGFYALNHGSANAFNASAFVPQWGQSLQYVPVIVYGMVGFELISAASDDLDNPAGVLPRATLTAGAVILVFYIASTAAVLVAIPVSEIDLVEGLVDTLRLLFPGDVGSLLVSALTIAALYTFFSNGVTWALGANRAAAAAAVAHHLPPVFGRLDSKRGTPIGAAVLLGIASSAILLLYAAVAGSNEDLFWSLFAFSGVIFFIPYVVMMAAYVKLIRAPGYRSKFSFAQSGIAGALALVCAVILVLSIALFLYVPGEGVQWAVLIGAIVLIVIGEFLLQARASRKGEG